MLSIADYLLLLAVPILATYFFQFAKTKKMLDEVEQKRYVKGIGFKWNWAPMILLFGALLYFRSFDTRLAISLTIVLLATVEEYRHHKKLKSLRIDPAFQRRLLKVSSLSFVGTACILASFVLSANPT